MSDILNVLKFWLKIWFFGHLRVLVISLLLFFVLLGRLNKWYHSLIELNIVRFKCEMLSFTSTTNELNLRKLRDESHIPNI